MRDAGNRQSCLARAFCSDGAFRPEKPGEAQTFEAQWARSRPVSAVIPGPRPEPGHESGCASVIFPCSAARRSRCSRPRDGGIYVDATFGAGGYSRAILDVAGTRVIGIDRDRTAIPGGFDLVDRSDGRLTLVEDRFSNLAEVCAAQGVAAVDGVVMDVGVSSMQLDQAERGFSFRLDGPLDMRMGHDGPTAADVIAGASEADLANIIYIFGEERHSRAVASAIVAARKEAPIATTRALADIVSKVVWSKPGEIHPATRTFQALADFRQRGTRRTASGAGGGRARAEAGRPAGGGVVSFAGRPHRQEFPGRTRQGRRRLAASAGSRTRPRRALPF